MKDQKQTAEEWLISECGLTSEQLERPKKANVGITLYEIRIYGDLRAEEARVKLDARMKTTELYRKAYQDGRDELLDKERERMVQVNVGRLMVAFVQDRAEKGKEKK